MTSRTARKRITRTSPLVVTLAAFLSISTLSAQTSPSSQHPFGEMQHSPAPAKSQTVAFLFPEQITIPAGKASPVDLHFRVAPGLHINSHQPHTEDLIPTTINIPEASGVQLTDAHFPKGSDFTFAISPTDKLSVYTGEFTIQTNLIAKPGEHLVEATLRYQACNNEACMPPRSIPVVLDVIAK